MGILPKSGPQRSILCFILAGYFTTEKFFCKSSVRPFFPQLWVGAAAKRLGGCGMGGWGAKECLWAEAKTLLPANRRRSSHDTTFLRNHPIGKFKSPVINEICY